MTSPKLTISETRVRKQAIECGEEEVYCMMWRCECGETFPHQSKFCNECGAEVIPPPLPDPKEIEKTEKRIKELEIAIEKYEKELDELERSRR